MFPLEVLRKRKKVKKYWVLSTGEEKDKRVIRKRG
jgi:hypothetical protein